MVLIITRRGVNLIDIYDLDRIGDRLACRARVNLGSDCQVGRTAGAQIADGPGSTVIESLGG